MKPPATLQGNQLVDTNDDVSQRPRPQRRPYALIQTGVSSDAA